MLPNLPTSTQHNMKRATQRSHDLLIDFIGYFLPQMTFPLFKNLNMTLSVSVFKNSSLFQKKTIFK